MANVYATPGTENKPSSRLSGLRQGLLITLITLVLVLIFLEIGLRLFAPQIVPSLSGLFQSDPLAGYRLRPNASVHYRSSEADVTFHTDNYGLRLPDKSDARAQPSVLALGDSFTFGMNVQDEQAYPALLNKQWHTLNAGVFGYGTDNEAAWLDEHGWRTNPRVVLLGFFVGNDVKDVMLGITKTVATADGRLVAASTSTDAMNRGEEGQDAPKTSGIRGWLENNSHAYLFLRSLWYNTLGKGKTKVSKLTIFDAASFYRKDVPPELQAGWDKTLGIVKAMQADCKAHGAQLVLVAIPTREQVYLRSWDDVKAQFGLNDAEFDLGLPQRKLSDFASAQGLAYIDLLPAFRAANADSNLYFHIDRHWTAAGHKLAADEIARELTKQGLLK